MSRTVSYGTSVAFSFGNNILGDLAEPVALTDAATLGTVMAGSQTSGTVPSFALSSGVSFRLSTTRAVHAVVPVTFQSTSIAASTCQVDVSPDNTTYTTLVTKTLPAVAILSGSVDEVNVFLPRSWYGKLTVSSASLGTGRYY